MRELSVPGFGLVQYAQWLHPKETEKKVSATFLDLLRRFIRPGDTVIDVGAHTGDTTLPMALLAGPEGCVIALEPNPYVFRVLSQNASLNPSLTNIKPFNLAATAEDGEFVFHYSDSGYCNGGFFSEISSRGHGHHHELKVTGRRLGKLLRSGVCPDSARLSFIKIDTEGYDRQVIESVRDIIDVQRPTLMVEAYKRLSRAERIALFESVCRMGYTCHTFAGSEIGEALSLASFLRGTHFDFLGIPPDSAGAAVTR